MVNPVTAQLINDMSVLYQAKSKEALTVYPLCEMTIPVKQFEHMRAR